MYIIENNSGNYYNANTKCWGPECAATEYTEGELPDTVTATDDDCNDTDLELVIHDDLSAETFDARYYADDAHECSAVVRDA